MRRSREEIRAGMLEACQFSSLSVSQLMTRQNLSHKILKIHLTYLIHDGLITCMKVGKQFQILATESGVNALKGWQQGNFLRKRDHESTTPF